MGHIHCYLLTHRKRWGLSQKELARLLGARTGTVISRLEKLKRHPSLKAAIAVQIIFGTSLEEMFPKLFSEVEDELVRRVYELHTELQGTPSTTTRVKLDLLDAALDRAKARNTAAA